MNRIRLKEKKDKKIRNHYLWVFRDDVATHFKDRQEIEDGSIVEVFDAEDKFLGIGAYNSRSHILVRMLSRQNVPVTRDFLRHRLARAIEYRAAWAGPSEAVRLVHAEADLLPGLIVDRYGEILVVQLRTLGMDRMKHDVVECLVELTHPEGILERSDMDSRTEEGLEKSIGVLYGDVPDRVEIAEDGVRFLVDLKSGHKTGFYLDQRDNRRLVRSLLKPNQSGLDLFCYSGAFSVAMAAAGARVTGVDIDAAALKTASENAGLNGVAERCTFEAADAFEFLQQALLASPDRQRKYDAIVIDPPALAKRKEGVEKLKWTYWKLLSGALPLLNPGGTIVLSSCAYHMSVDRMLEAARFASADLGLRLRVSDLTYQPADHPWILQVPETLYLKTLYLQRT